MKKTNLPRPRLFVMNDPYPLRISAQLAQEIGFNESVILLQLEYLISISNTELRDGLLWTYQSLDDLNSYFPWWGRQTINRAIHNLQQKGLIRIGNFNQRKSDHTRWFALDPEGVSRLNSVRLDTGVVMTENARRAPKNPKKPTEPRTPESHFETGESHFETTLPETPTETPPKESLTAAALINSGQQNFSAAAGVDSEPSPQPAPKTGDWNLESLARLNLVSRRKIAEMRKAGTDPRAFAQWLAEAHRKTGMTNPIGYAVQNAIEYPEGRNLAASPFGCQSQADLLVWLAKAIAGYPLDAAPDIAAMLRGISQTNLRSLFLALGGDEDDIPTAYVPPAPEILPAKPEPEEKPMPVELPDFVIKKHQEIREILAQR